MTELRYTNEEGFDAVLSCLDVKTSQHMIDIFQKFELRCKFIKNFDKYFPYDGDAYYVYWYEYLPFVEMFKIADLTIEENTKLLMTHFYIGDYDQGNDTINPRYFDDVLFSIQNGIDVNFNFKHFDLISLCVQNVSNETTDTDKIILKRLLEAGDYDEKLVKQSLQNFIKFDFYIHRHIVLEFTVVLDIIVEAL